MAKATPKTVAGKTHKGVKRLKPMQEMALARIVEIADRAYGDGLIGNYYRGEGHGDTLADFVMRELRDVFDPDATEYENLFESRRGIGLAIKQLRDVEAALHRELVKLQSQQPLATERPKGRAHKKSTAGKVDKRR